MNYKHIIIAASVACAAFLGCEEVEIKRAVHTFFYPLNFTIDTLSYGNEIDLRFTDCNNYSADKTKYHKDRYKQYVYYFSDFGYREDHEWYWGDDCCDDPGPSHHSWVCVCDIKSIHIVSNNDFDEKHPAGSNADDLFSIRLESAYPFIKNGYQANYDNHSHKFPLNNIDPDYLKLNGHWLGNISTNKMPTEKGSYSFTLSLEMGADPVTGYTPTFDSQTFKLTF